MVRGNCICQLLYLEKESMMYFLRWLLKRMFTTLSGPFEWVIEYRKLIIDIPFLAILVTCLVGALWFIGAGLFIIWLLGNRPPEYLFYLILAVPPLFFIYNWLMVMYAIYDRERQQTFDALKGKYD